MFVAVFCLTSQGCSFPIEFSSRQETEKEVLEKDPAFSTVLAEQAHIAEEINKIKAQYAGKSKRIKGEIAGLKNNLAISRNKMQVKLRSLDAQLDPYRKELRIRVERLSTELKLKESSLSAIKKMINRLANLAEQEKAPETSATKPSEWHREKGSLEREASLLEGEASSLRGAIRLLRLKLKLLK
ncbi:MAG: hypothetical protein HQ558_01810 [Candidatus Omnitrophica bacterium]|nr:hypothetical protein [Candidatus Omnitrophota bacterium]